MRRLSSGLTRVAVGLFLLLGLSQGLRAQTPETGTPQTAAKACDVQRPALPGFTVTPQSGAVVGQPFTLDWAAAMPSGAKAATPTYLVILAPATARFEGRGFFALTPDAAGPYGMRYGAGRARAIVPLHTAFSDIAGTLAILFQEAQETAVDWAVVQADDCGEMVSGHASGTFLVDVMPGPPRLIGRDEFAARQPDATFDPKRGHFQARVYGSTVEVADLRSGEIVLQATGENPIFSPTGRFLVLDTGEEQTVDIFDLAVGRRVASFNMIEGLYWSHGDSFVYADGSWYGQVSILGTLLGAGQDAASPEPEEDAGMAEAEADAQSVEGTRPGQEFSPGDSDTTASVGSMVWQANVSVESGAAVFFNIEWHLMGYVEEDFADGSEKGGRILDLGRARPMLKFRDLAGLEAALAKDFSLPGMQLRGWDSGHGLARTHNFEYVEEEEEFVEEDDEEESAGDETVAASSAEAGQEDAEDFQPDLWVQEYNRNFLFDQTPTQDEAVAGPVLVAARDVSAGIVRSAVPIGEIAAAQGFVGGEALGLLSRRELANLRSGRDNDALRVISDRLAPFYASHPQEWLFARDGPTPYDTAPFPDPAVEPMPNDGSWVDLAQEGRDTWNWKLGSAEFWLTQTVGSGRMGHSFNFSMLRLGDGRLDRTDPLHGLEAPAEDGSPVEVSLWEIGDLRGSLASAFAEPSFVAIASERYLLISSKPVVRLIAFDLVSFQPACAIAAPADAADVERIELSRDARHLFQFNRNGKVNIYDCRDGSRVLAGVVADNELVVMDDQGYFDGSEDAAAYVELKIPGLAGRHVLSQFASKLRHPRLLQEVLSGKRREEAAPALAPPSGVVSAASGGGGLDVAAASPTGLRAVEIFADGRLALRRELDGRSAIARIDGGELPETGFATVVVVDTDGLTSAPVSVMLGDRRRTSSGRLVGMLVGVDAYPDMPGANLRFAGADARRIAAAAGGSTLYSATELAVLTDGEATSAAILDRVDAMVAAAGEGDTILFSFAGHGLVGADGGLRLGLSETRSGDIERTSLDFAAVVARLAKARAKVVVLLDACHSGASGKEANDAGVRQLVTGSGAGIVVLAASKGRQLSEETAALGGGRFSVALAGSLTENRAQADLDANGALSVLELYRAVKTNVAASTDNRQIPWISRNQIYGDFDIF